MNSKQECIAKAYGEYWETVKVFVNESGWCYQRKNISFDKLSKEIMIEFNGYDFRPIVLNGIENNNGWIKIESEDDLPKEEKAMYRIGMFMNDGVFNQDNNLYNLKTVLEALEWNYTHYQPITKPEPPLH